MKVKVSVPDRFGCGHYRALYPGWAVQQAEDVEVEFVEGHRMNIDERGRIQNLAPVECDVFVISRPLRRLNAQSIPFIRAQGAAVVVDIDDDFSCVDPAHGGWRHWQPHLNPESNRDWLKQACACADLVTCTTPALARRYGSHGRVAVLPNFVPKKMLGTLPEQERDGRTIGWPGDVSTHPRDLEATRGGVGMACQEVDAKFALIGAGEEKAKQQLHLHGVEFENRGPRTLEDYPHAVAALDVGIVPLADTMFNEAKSALKGLEMAACGVPFVASPRYDYRRIAKDGMGVLADPKAKKWKRAVLDVLANREEYAAQVRDGVKKHLYEDHAWRWAEAWEEARKNRAQSSVLLAA